VNPEDLLANLDEEQRAAASSLRGPVCILAGAGTGKTRTITHRIAYGIATGYFSANRVLALTYTNKAAGELRARLRSLGQGSVTAKTFHAAALGQLEFFWPQFAVKQVPRVLESKAALLTSLAKERRIKVDSATLLDLAAEIEWRKYSLLSLEQYREQQRTLPSGLTKTQCFELMTAYEDAKIDSNQIDWEDVLVLCLGMLRAEPRALAHVQQQYRFFTVDEYQDISPLQHALLDTWLGDRNDLCVVGDPNQTIYSFTGASSSFLQTFYSRYENATVVELTSNYRSTKQIVTFANRLTVNDSSLEPLESQQELGMAPQVLDFANRTEEAAFVAKQIRSAIDRGLKPAEIAVLYRVNGQSELLENALAQLGIDYQLKGGERFFQRTEIQDAMRAIRAEIAAKSARHTREALVEIMRSLGWSLKAPEVGSGRERWESLSALLAIMDELPDETDLPSFYAELEERQRSQHEPVKAAVTLATIHAAKGLEWEQVFLFGLTDGYLPISYAKTETAIAEERRLLYVGITRARKVLTLSWSRESEPSRFLKLLEPQLGRAV
jgi:DNA helicase-2/ATP-dependent DNA helicase PcrA